MFDLPGLSFHAETYVYIRIRNFHSLWTVRSKHLLTSQITVPIDHGTTPAVLHDSKPRRSSSSAVPSRPIPRFCSRRGTPKSQIHFFRFETTPPDATSPTPPSGFLIRRTRNIPHRRARGAGLIGPPLPRASLLGSVRRRQWPEPRMLLSRPSSPRRPLHLLLQRPRAALFGLPATQKVLAEAAALEGGSPAAVFNWENTVDAEMLYMDVADEPALRRQPNGVPKGIGLGARNLFDDLQKQTV